MTTKPLALIVGASRGLGLLVAQDLLARGHRVVLAARTQDTLDQAAQHLITQGADRADVHTQVLDVSNREQVQRAIEQVEDEVAAIDVAIHVAGVISVGPSENTTHDHMEKALHIMAWGPIHLAEALIPRMRERHRGRFGVVTSVGGMVSSPHLLAYSTAKFAAVGFTEGLAASLSGTGVSATVIVPGLMRTGSHTAAEFFGDPVKEYAWFAPSAALPLVSMDAVKAARRMVDGVLAGKPYVLLSPLTKVAVRVHGVAPGLTTRAVGLVTRLLPAAVDGGEKTHPGVDVAPLAGKTVRFLTGLGDRAARRNREPGLDKPSS